MVFTHVRGLLVQEDVRFIPGHVPLYQLHNNWFHSEAVDPSTKSVR